jgi:hypothetical protein
MYGDKSVKLTRQELYQEVWTDPASKVAMKYGMSDVGLAKICKRNSIPRPPLGYLRQQSCRQELPRRY